MKFRLDFLTTHREARIAVILIGFGLFVMPFLVYLVGRLTLGPSEAGLSGFLKTLYGSFVTLRPTAWALLLGPYLLFWALRLASRPLRRSRRA
jgi:hypothetical protein